MNELSFIHLEQQTFLNFSNDCHLSSFLPQVYLYILSSLNLINGGGDYCSFISFLTTAGKIVLEFANGDLIKCVPKLCCSLLIVLSI